MPDLYADVVTCSSRPTYFAASDSAAYRRTTCAHCGPTQAGVIGFTQGGHVFWLRCTNCGRGIIEVNGTVSPGTKPLSVPLGLPPAELAAWEEVRECLSVSASNAAVMLCRKLLLHLAVGAGLPPKDDRDRAPSFAAAIEHLKSEGLITPKMVPWVERIKDVGNVANHELSPVDPALALDVAKFTEQLLRLNYEMDALMAREGIVSDESGSDGGVMARMMVSSPPSQWVS